MPLALLVTVRFHDGRYHGADDWPPAPARLFQALVSAAARGATLSEEDKKAMLWLEVLSGQSPPVIAAPWARNGREFTTFVPNNDLDSVDGDPRRVGEIRAGKTIRPQLFDAEIPLLYAWTFSDEENGRRQAQTVCVISERLYQFGRGVDMAWASAEVLDPDEAHAKLAAYPGALHRPNNGGNGALLLCPQSGSLASLIERFNKNRQRFRTTYAPTPTKKDPSLTKPAGQLFTQPPRPRFRAVPYDSLTERHLFDLRGSNTHADFAAWPLTDAVLLVERVRDAAALRLKTALPGNEDLIDRVFVGRNSKEADKAARLSIVPLPSIGHAHADRAIHRIMIEVPPNCPLRAADVIWAFSGLDFGVDYKTGEILHEDQPVLTSAVDEKMLAHYGLNAGERDTYRLWRTVTPAALPQRATRRRIDPSRLRERKEQKNGSERMREESRAATAVLEALRHAGLRGNAQTVRVQREPFEGNDARAESFAHGTRFTKERLWHVEIAFAAPVHGPIILGDGRYLGLGLMARVREHARDVLILSIRGKLPAVEHRGIVLDAVRRALMSRAANARGHIPVLFSGHDSGAGAARSGHHRHVYLLSDDANNDGLLDRIVIIAPWLVDRSWRPSGEDRAQFENVVSGLEFVRAGAAGVLAMGVAQEPNIGDPLFAHARTWRSYASYCPTRHPKRDVDAADIVVEDLLKECARRQLPRPEVEITRLDIGPRGGIGAEARLRFRTVVAGPIVLGRSAHRGGGLFVAEP